MHILYLWVPCHCRVGLCYMLITKAWHCKHAVNIGLPSIGHLPSKLLYWMTRDARWLVLHRCLGDSEHIYRGKQGSIWGRTPDPAFSALWYALLAYAWPSHLCFPTANHLRVTWEAVHYSATEAALDSDISDLQIRTSNLVMTQNTTAYQPSIFIASTSSESIITHVLVWWTTMLHDHKAVDVADS